MRQRKVFDPSSPAQRALRAEQERAIAHSVLSPDDHRDWRQRPVYDPATTTPYIRPGASAVLPRRVGCWRHWPDGTRTPA